jgi:hypothetical protein
MDDQLKLSTLVMKPLTRWWTETQRDGEDWPLTLVRTGDLEGEGGWEV